MIDFSGRTALVTGAGLGIGQACAVALARHGADVAINYLTSAEGARETRAQVEALGRKAIVVQADVSKSDQVRAMAEEVERLLAPVDILVNNAGWARMQPMEEITEADWDEVIAVNLKSVFLVTGALLPGMQQRGWGRIVNVSSGAAQMGGGMGIHYTAAKGGVDALTRAYAKRLVTEGITVNTVAPILIETGSKRDNEARRKMVPMGRQGTPQEVADAVVLCAGTEFMTGQSVHMSGGVYYH
ncbi:MAG: SDR family NAD(P)-dependent oxidoreductase [SAR324 cluster bacterium]|nr:SDR family NAD(P)-dependent oxidoreductase [SAR324 cluster bacterium]